jgi:thiol:disulfide interchange protein DsbC
MILRYFVSAGIIFFLAFSTLLAESASAFQGPGCMGECADCHKLTNAEASKLLRADKFGAEITEIKMSPVKGLWEVVFSKEGRTGAAYLDFGKKYLVEGKFTALENLEKEIEKSEAARAPKKVDLKKIPLDGAIVFGDKNAAKKIIVFDDPDCPYCKKLHEDMKKIIEQRKDIAFYIKLFPLPMHPDAYEKSKTIICEKSAKLLEDAFEGKTLPKATCKAEEVDNNIKLAGELGLHGTPAIILPDGTLIPGYAPAETLIQMIDAKPQHGVSAEGNKK